MIRQYSRHVFQNAAASDMGEGMDRNLANQVQHRLDVNPGGFHQGISQGFLANALVQIGFTDFDDFADQ